MAIFPKAQRAAGGIFDRINQATMSPAFGLGMGFLQGSPQMGFQNAAMLNEARADEERRRQAAEMAQRKFQAQQEQQAREAQMKAARFALDEKKYGLDERKLEQQARFQSAQLAQLPSDARSALFAAGGDEEAAQQLLQQRLLRGQQGISFTTPDGSVITIGGTGGGQAATGGPQGAAPIRPPNTQQPFDFDVIEKATGPVDAMLGILERTPLFGPTLAELAGGPGAGTDQRRARLVMEDINNDIRKAFAINSSRVSNFDLKLAEKMLPASLGVLTSEKAAVTDLVQLRDLIEKDISQNITAIQSPLLRPTDRAEIQGVINSLSSASDKIGAVLDTREIAVQAKGRGQGSEGETRLPGGVTVPRQGAPAEGGAPTRFRFNPETGELEPA